MNPYNNYSNDQDRFFLAPFLVGGLAGTALGYGIANNNDINNNCCCNNMYQYPVQPIPYSYNNYNTYYPCPYSNQNQIPNNTSSNNFNNYYY